MKFAISTLLLALLAASVEGHYVKVGKVQPRIVGGTPVSQGEFPYYGKHCLALTAHTIPLVNLLHYSVSFFQLAW